MRQRRGAVVTPAVICSHRSLIMLEVVSGALRIMLKASSGTTSCELKEPVQGSDLSLKSPVEWQR
jgi:hypothetical protein